MLDGLGICISKDNLRFGLGVRKKESGCCLVVDCAGACVGKLLSNFASRAIFLSGVESKGALKIFVSRCVVTRLILGGGQRRFVEEKGKNLLGTSLLNLSVEGWSMSSSFALVKKTSVPLCINN